MTNFKSIAEVTELLNVSNQGVKYWIEKYNIPFRLEKHKGAKRKIFLDYDALKEALEIKG